MTTRKSKKDDTDDRTIQHIPVHQQNADEMFDPRHPAASSFAVAQPAAGVVANDVEERGQNLAGGQKADDAEKTFSDQRDVLLENYKRDLRNANPASAEPPKVEGDKTAE